MSKDLTHLCSPSIVLFLLCPKQVHPAAPWLRVPAGRRWLTQHSQGRLGAVSSFSLCLLLSLFCSEFSTGCVCMKVKGQL